MNEFIYNQVTSDSGGILSKSCVADKNSQEWLDDPCCNPLKEWQTPCVFRTITAPKSYLQVNDEKTARYNILILIILVIILN